MKKVLVLTDFSEKAEQAAIYAFQIAAVSNSTVLLHHFFDTQYLFPPEAGIFSYPEETNFRNEEIEQALDKLSVRLRTEFELNYSTKSPEVICSNSPGPINGKLESLIQENAISLIIMGDQSEEEVLSRFLFGNESHTVIEEATCPVMLVPENLEFRPFKKILFASQLHHSESEALSFLTGIASLWQARIKLVHITDRNLNHLVLLDYKSSFEGLISNVSAPGIEYDIVYGTDVADTLKSYIDEDKADMIVLVHKTRSKIGQFLHRSTSKAMMNYHQVPLLVLRK